jgi:hypothetical protein
MQFRERKWVVTFREDLFSGTITDTKIAGKVFEFAVSIHAENDFLLFSHPDRIPVDVKKRVRVEMRKLIQNRFQLPQPPTRETILKLFYEQQRSR